MADDANYDDDYGDDYHNYWDDDGQYWDDDSYEGYVSTSLNPGWWLTVGSFFLAVVVMLCVLPCIVYQHKWKRRQAKDTEKKLEGILKDAGITPAAYQMMDEDSPEKQLHKVKSSFKTVTRFDRETKRLLQYALPFSIASAISAVLSSVVLALIGHFVGTKELAAVAVLDILLGIMGEFLEGPLAANTVLCSQAVGSGNNFLAGQYIQLSLIFYFILQIPLLVIFYLFTAEIIMWLGWGDEHVAKAAQDFVRIYIWSDLLDSVTGAVENLLETTGHEMYSTFMGVVHDAAVVGVLVILLVTGVDVSLQIVAWVCVGASLFYLISTVGLAVCFGWLKPFYKGMLRNFSLNNRTAVANMMKTAPPLSIGSVLSNAEWSILTVFASYLGPAEVAAWAIIGEVWEVFETTIEGLGDAAEIRVSYHLGLGHPYKAKLSAYKSLYMGSLNAIFVSGIFFLLLPYIPEFFTVDETLQGMIAECLPLTVIGNLLMTVGILAWYAIGAQGRYKTGTIVMFCVSWGITLPLAAVSTYVLRVDLQGLVTSVVLGYVGVGAALLYMLLTSDWCAQAEKIRRQIVEEEEKDSETLWAALQAHRSRQARQVATGRIKLLSAPPGSLGIAVGTMPDRKTAIITSVLHSSPFRGMVFPGDGLIAVDGVSVLSLPVERIYEIIDANDHLDRQISVEMVTPYHFREDETSEGKAKDVSDIADFEEEEILLPSWWDESDEGPTFT